MYFQMCVTVTGGFICHYLHVACVLSCLLLRALWDLEDHLGQLEHL